MAKAASKGKLANKVSSKKNKKSLSVKNQKTLENSDKFKVGSKNDNIPKGKFIFIGFIFTLCTVHIGVSHVHLGFEVLHSDLLQIDDIK